MARKKPAARTPPPLDPTRLSVEELGQVLGKAGAKEVTTDRIRADIAAGAPVHKDGTLHFVRYLAWLVQETKG